MSRKDDRDRAARKAGYPEYAGWTADQLSNERRSICLQIQALGQQHHALRLRSDWLKLRVRAVRDGDEGFGISDHAVLRYLQRVKGVDMNAVRAEIRERVGRSGVDKTLPDQITTDGDVSFAVGDGDSIVTIWTEPADV